jgi:Bacterial Ig domain
VRGDPDPAAPWTGTWRDPSFSPPLDGGRPANAVTGTNYMVQVDFRPMKVPWDDGKMRFWRNTAVAGLLQGQVAILRSGCNCTLGVEWDEDADNGFRPPGLIRASTTITPSLDGAGMLTDPQYYLLDHGVDYAPHPATHHLTLYRDRSGALVFSAGTINWSWGLDSHHDIDPNFVPIPPQSTPEPAMQQATVNLFADMCVQPRTLQPGLVPATASTDSTPPTSVITSPTNGGTVVMGSAVSITGTAVDTGDGVVGGVEVSVDGGLTWHPATGRANWSYSWKPTLLGSIKIQSRAVDDTGNLENAGSYITVTVVPRSPQILLFYNKTNGNNAIGRLNNIGDYVNLSAGVFALGWTHIVTGINNFLFFYRADTGYAWTGKLDDAGNYTDVGQPRLLPGAGWTHVVAGTNNILLFYDSSTGHTMLGRLDVDGSFEPLSARALPTGWTNIVAGVNNVFLFYNRDTGRAATGKLGIPTGNYVDLRAITGLSTGWTHIVAGVNNVLLFFNAGPGSAMTARLDDAGNLTYLRNPLWDADLGWTTIAAGVKNTVLLFYHAPSAQGATGTLDANGNYVHLMLHTGFSPGWTHIIGP